MEANAASKAEKLALARKKLREFESRKGRDGPSPSPSASSSTYYEQVGSAPNSYTGDINGHEGSANTVHSVLATPNMSTPDPMNPQHAANPLFTTTIHPNGGGGDTNQMTHRSLNGGSLASSSAQLEVDHLNAIIREKEQANEAVNNQLQELHGFYSQLHAAYSELSLRMNGSDQADSTKHYTTQISHLQSALSVLVSEKTSLQTELRKVKEELSRHETQINTHKSSHAEETARSEKVNNEVKKLQMELSEKNGILEKRLLELESERKESSELQAQMRTLQHERNEAQARLKNVYRDKETLEMDLKNLRKDIQMKEMHIKQLTAYQHQMPNEPQNTHNDYSQLSEECESLRAAVIRLQNECKEAKREAEEARSHYNDYGKQMNESYSKLNKEFDEVSATKFSLDVKCRELEDQLEVARNDLIVAQQRTVSGAASTVGGAVPQGLSEVEVVRKVEEATRRVNHGWEKRCEEREKEVEEMVHEKDRCLFEREQSIAELHIKLRILEEREREIREASGDMLSLSEQLQNEKATVSRAVAQNKELKEQIIETEDRLIALTQEKLESELARQAAEYQVKQLHMQLEQHGTQYQPSSPPLSTSSVSVPPTEEVVTSQPSLTLSNDELLKGRVNGLEEKQERGDEETKWPSYSDDEDDDGSESTKGPDYVGDREEMSRELEETRRQLEEVRTELRRSHTQNEQMNQIMRQNAEDENQNSILVELNQAVARINALAHENESLREEVEAVRCSSSLQTPTEGEVPHVQDVNQQIDANVAGLRIRRLEERNEELSEEVDHLKRLLNTAHSPMESTRIDENHHHHANVRECPPVSPVTDSTRNEESPTVTESNEATVTNVPPSLKLSKELVVGTSEWARVELEKRFSEAMSKMADIQENADRLEHINLQLQLENDTIADHVILYQHQRRLIRERLKQKDEQMAEMERERERVMMRCEELQDALLKVLEENGVVKPYERAPSGGPSKPPRRRAASRSYSHSTVDELSGDEERVVDAKDEQVPPRLEPSPPPISGENGEARVHGMQERAESKTEENVSEELRSNTSSPVFVDEKASLRKKAKDTAVQRILDLINDIKTPQHTQGDSNKLHCKQCIGEIQTI